MSGPTQAWRDEWFESRASAGTNAWRGVEAQHVVATMRLVDTLDEQAALEHLLEQSKPTSPAGTAPTHYLLSTPFRYRPVHASRFRHPSAPGVWYGGESMQTACAEVAHWRWRFLMDSEGLREQELLTQHTFFEAAVAGICVDLSRPPWAAARAAWTSPADYSSTQALAEAARARDVEWLKYESVRDPGGRCVAVLSVAALEMRNLTSQQTWHCKTTAAAVLMIHGSDRFSWSFPPSRPN